MSAPDISNFSLFLCLLLLIIPLITTWIFKLGIAKPIFISTTRMFVQLFLAGLFLKYLFEINNYFLNVLWLVVMLIVAMSTVIKSSELNIRLYAIPIFLSLTVSLLFIVLYFNILVIRLDDILEARYFIVLSGMLLGNSLRGNIIGITNFYRNLKKDEKRYMYHLSLGASQQEALIPYIIDSLGFALKPMLATMITIGIVALPGMMSGQILGGSDPMVAIKYQIAIMIAIFTTINISVGLTIIFTIKTSFDDFGILRNDIFKKKKI